MFDLTQTISWVMAGLGVAVVFLVALFSRRYMDGDAHAARYGRDLMGVTLCVVTLAFADHLAVVLAAWAGKGVFLSSLIGHYRQWDAARSAARQARLYFAVGFVLLALGFTMLALATDAWTLSAMMERRALIAPIDLWIAMVCLIVAAMIQSALFPFHGWLMGSMTAPTPISALMHAGLVNAGGFLVIRCAPLMDQAQGWFIALMIAGMLSVLVGGVAMRVQPTIKQALGCSTVAQMGFTLLQCGLGLYTAALAHLVLHGFYKAYHFLAAGSAVAHASAGASDSGRGIVAPLICAGVGAALFALFTGKDMTQPDSTFVLMLCVGIMASHMASTVWGMSHVRIWPRSVLTASALVASVGAYAGVMAVFQAIAPLDVPQPFGNVHAALCMVLLLAWIGGVTGAFKKSRRFYMAALQIMRPPLSTLTAFRRSYHAR